jgi:hypothetical protein
MKLKKLLSWLVTLAMVFALFPMDALASANSGHTVQVTLEYPSGAYYGETNHKVGEGVPVTLEYSNGTKRTEWTAPNGQATFTKVPNGAVVTVSAAGWVNNAVLGYVDNEAYYEGDFQDPTTHEWQPLSGSASYAETFDGLNEPFTVNEDVEKTLIFTKSDRTSFNHIDVLTDAGFYYSVIDGDNTDPVYFEYTFTEDNQPILTMWYSYDAGSNDDVYILKNGNPVPGHGDVVTDWLWDNQASRWEYAIQRQGGFPRNGVTYHYIITLDVPTDVTDVTVPMTFEGSFEYSASKSTVNTCTANNDTNGVGYDFKLGGSADDPIYATGNLIITKTVDNGSGDGDTFYFDVFGPTDNKEVGAEHHTFSMRAGGMDMRNLPVGAYVIQETHYIEEGSVDEIPIVPSEEEENAGISTKYFVEGLVQRNVLKPNEDSNIVVDFTNVQADDNTGGLIVKKTIKGLDEVPEELNFAIKQGETTIDTVTLYRKDFNKDNETGAFVHAGKSVALAAGDYTVTETNPDVTGYIRDTTPSVVQDVTVVAGLTKTVGFVNAYTQPTLTVKHVYGADNTEYPDVTSPIKDVTVPVGDEITTGRTIAPITPFFEVEGVRYVLSTENPREITTDPAGTKYGFSEGGGHAIKSGAMPEANVTITYKYVPDTDYGVTYTVGGELPPGAQTTFTDSYSPYYAGNPVTVLPIPTTTVDGYKFTGWNLVPLDGEDPALAITNGGFTMPARDVVLVGEWAKDLTKQKKADYTINFFVDGAEQKDDVLGGTKTVWINGDVTLAVEYEEDADKYEGYKLDEEASSDVPASVVTTGNVYNIYYVPDDTVSKPYSYEINFFVDGVPQPDDQLKGSTTVWVNDITTTLAVDYTADANKYPGYKLDEVASSVVPATVQSATNIYNIYYVTDDANTKTLSYTVEYHRDGVFFEAGTGRTIPVQILQPDTLAVENLDRDPDRYAAEGYKFDSISPDVNNGDLVANGTVIVINYVTDLATTYTIEYYYDGVMDPALTVYGNGQVGETVTYAEQLKPNFEFDYADPAGSIELVKTPESNVIKVYYKSIPVVIDPEAETMNIRVKHEYYLDGELEDYDYGDGDGYEVEVAIDTPTDLSQYADKGIFKGTFYEFRYPVTIEENRPDAEIEENQVFSADETAEPAAETPAEPAPEVPAEPAPEVPAEPAPETPAEPAPEVPSEPVVEIFAEVIGDAYVTTSRQSDYVVLPVAAFGLMDIIDPNAQVYTADEFAILNDDDADEEFVPADTTETINLEIIKTDLENGETFTFNKDTEYTIIIKYYAESTPEPAAPAAPAAPEAPAYDDTDDSETDTAVDSVQDSTAPLSNNVEINDNQVPLAAPPETTVILDEEIPLASLPATGGAAKKAAPAAGIMALLGGLLLGLKGLKKDDEE